MQRLLQGQVNRYRCYAPEFWWMQKIMRILIRTGLWGKGVSLPAHPQMQWGHRQVKIISDVIEQSIHFTDVYRMMIRPLSGGLESNARLFYLPYFPFLFTTGGGAVGSGAYEALSFYITSKPLIIPPPKLHWIMYPSFYNLTDMMT